MSSSALRRVQPATLIKRIAFGGIGLAIFSKALMSTAKAESSAPVRVFGRGPAFVSLRLEDSEVVNHNTKRLRFKLPHEDSISGLTLTSAVLTVSWPKGRWLPVARPYTPVSAIDEPGFLDLLVKRYPDGKQSVHLHSLTPGQSLLFAAALQGFQWKPNSFPHVTLIAGGSGITPIYQLTQGILGNAEDKTTITLVYGANSDQDILLKKEFEQFENKFPGRFKAVYTVSHPVEGSPFRRGYVDKKLLEEVALPPENGETKVFVCGPPAMERSLIGKKGVLGLLEQLGYRKDQVHTF
ncbi:oxidoreductase NAD-binding domain-containing protein [Ilyonectria sp. MPI-CAGE-AT-0026]|nr:oxidoreductase NAD-binding domain-containing protein [Ilyonectria sp. MPI-CAGE-AT-0026]